MDNVFQLFIYVRLCKNNLDHLKGLLNMKIAKLAPLSLLICSPLFAGQGDQISNSRYSVSTHNAYALNGINVASMNAHMKESKSFAYLASLRVGGEIGNVDFADDIEDLVDELDRDDITLDEANGLIDRFNSVLKAAGQQGYGDVNVGLEIPLSFLWKREKDAFSVSSRTYGTAHVEILDDNVRYNPLQQTIETNSAGYVKVADMLEISLGYSRLVWQSQQGDLHVGARLNVQKLGLSKQVIGFQAADGDEDLSDTFIDDYEDFKNDSTQLALDMSAYWSAKNYSLGLTLSNINEPEFEYGELGKDCHKLTNDISQSNCFTALSFSNRIDLTETYKATSYATAQANYINDAATFSVDVSLESEHTTPVGINEQWMTASIAYKPQTSFAPNSRLTYSNNLSGSKLKYVSGELTWGWFGLGLGYSLDDTIIDGDSTTRGAFINLAISNQF